MGIDAKMLVKTRLVVSPKMVEALSRQIAIDMPEGTFWEHTIKDNTVLTKVAEYIQDGPDILPAEGETLIEVSLASRYYHPAYRRSDPNESIMIAEWLESAIPGCEVWYGGDSSGVLAVPFTKELRQELADDYSTWQEG